MAKYLRFIEEKLPDGRSQFDVVNKKSGDLLGTIYWFGHWKQYVVSFEELAEFSADCLRDIAAFMEEMKK